MIPGPPIKQAGQAGHKIGGGRHVMVQTGTPGSDSPAELQPVSLSPVLTASRESATKKKTKESHGATQSWEDGTQVR